MDSAIAAAKEKERDKEKEKEKDKEKEKEKEREVDMEAALYSNCLLLGLDAAVLGPSGMPRSGLFRHSNPRMGEALLHFLLCALRGPTQSAKDFAGVWPIFDAAQSRDFRKIVQNLINELEAQGALPRSNSRVSSLATCCGQRFVELLWQLSAHALREVHKRSFPADVTLNPLPASLTEVVAHNTHAAALLAVTKSRIAVERRRFLEGATAAVRRQALWSGLAHDMTAEYRELCAEEAYLHQELEKLHELKKLKGGAHDDSLKGVEADQTFDSVARASHLWESLISQTAHHEKLASGPIEDLIAHREHRYRVSGAALRAAIERSSSTASSDLSAFVAEEAFDQAKNDGDSPQQINYGYRQESVREKMDSYALEVYGSEETRNKVDDRAGKGAASLDVAEIIRRWTHALQRIHKQSLRLARSNDGEGPELMKESSVQGDHGHDQALRATLAEHRQHLANIQVLIRQLKEAMPGMEASIAALHEQVSKTNHLSVMAPAASSSPLSDRLVLPKEVTANHTVEGIFKNMPLQLELVPPSPALKLPQLFSLSPVTMGKASHRHHTSIPRMRSLEVPVEGENWNSQASSRNTSQKELEESRDEGLASLRQAVHNAALSGPDTISESISDKSANGTEHFFTPVISSSLDAENGVEISMHNLRSNMQSMRFSQEYYRLGDQSSIDTKRDNTGNALSKSLKYGAISYQQATTLAGDEQGLVGASERIEGELVRPFSPPLLTELSSFGETYDDLLAPMSEVDVALMDCSMQTLHA